MKLHVLSLFCLPVNLLIVCAPLSAVWRLRNQVPSCICACPTPQASPGGSAFESHFEQTQSCHQHKQSGNIVQFQCESGKPWQLNDRRMGRLRRRRRGRQAKNCMEDCSPKTPGTLNFCALTPVQQCRRWRGSRREGRQVNRLTGFCKLALAAIWPLAGHPAARHQSVGML